MSHRSIAVIPPKDRFSLPEVLEILEPLGCKREDLFDYLRQGKLRAVCYPYRLELDREVPIEPDEWPEWWRDACSFPVFDGWIGDMNVAEHETRIPLHIVPRAARADCDRVLKDGGKAATSSPVYVLRDELKRFSNWLQNPSKSRPGRRRKGAGRPRKHEYSVIDARLEKRFKSMGRSGFERPRDVIADLEQQLGDLHNLPDSTLRNHISTWIEDRTARNG